MVITLYLVHFKVLTHKTWIWNEKDRMREEENRLNLVQMLRLKVVKGALSLLVLTVVITYTCLYTLTFVNQFQPQSIPFPLPAAAKDTDTGDEYANTAKNQQTQSIFTLVQDTSKESGGGQAEVGNTEGLVKFTTKLPATAITTTKNNGSHAQDSYTLRIAHHEFSDDLLLESISREDSSGEDANDASVVDAVVDQTEEIQVTRKKNLKPKVKTNKAVWPITLNPSNASVLRHMDFSKYSSEEQIFLKKHLSVLVKRATTVGNICKKQPSHLHTPSGANHLVWDTVHKPNIVWCPNYKVASTSMMMSFMKVSSSSSSMKPKHRVKQSDVRDLYWRPKKGKEQARVLRNSVRVIIVRHPFTRILSAYRDKMTKMEPGPKKFGFRKLQKEIIAQYRTANSSIDSPFPTFPEFVQYVIDETEGLISTQDWREKVRCWVTYWAHCNVCTTDYSFIMKLETMADDKKFLVTLANMKELKKASSDEWLHLKNATSRDLAPQFYSQLTRGQIMHLYDHYKLDFDLFGYNVDDYLALV